MLTIERIKTGVDKLVVKYGIKKCLLFGAYAKGTTTEKSDLDFLVEFNTPAVSLLTISSLKNSLEDEFAVPVNVLHYPLPDDSFLEIDKIIDIYG